MSERAIPLPSNAELELLGILWSRGPSTVRQIHENGGGGTGYTTTLKTLQRMTDKGLVERDTRPHRHIYSAAQEADQVRRQLVGQLLRQAFDGSITALLLAALSTRPTSAGELANIRQLLNDYEGR